MSPEDYQQVKEIFQSLLELPTDRRAAELDVRCPDPGLRREVERLLDSYESGYLEQPLAASLSVDMLDSGHQIGHYKIIKKIGSGGMGDVYLAEDGKLGRHVAIKLLPEASINDVDRLRRFEGEARTASALNHPNILTVFEIGKTDHTHYIATEYIDGDTLRSKMNRASLCVSEALDIAVQCSSALAVAHDSGIIHRDIKPENIMVRRDKLVKLLDFGLAKLVERREATPGHDALTENHVKTAPGVVMGTVQYMSPEQTRGQATDARTDIWSLGCVIYEMLTGNPPFRGDTTADLIAEIVVSCPAPMSPIDGYIPDRLREIVDKTLKKAPDERYQTAKDLVNDLRRVERKLDLESQLAEMGTTTSLSDRWETGANLENLRVFPKSVFFSGKHLVLVGREKEIGQAKDLLRDREVRLLTLTGVGGTGKTTLAKAIAIEMQSEFEEGVCFVELAAVRDPDRVVATIAQAFDLNETGSKPILEILKGYLREKRTLLMVDNFEQVVVAAPVLKELTDHAPDLKILVTSRVILDLSSEIELRISTLQVPELSGHLTLDALSKNPSVELFVRRATMADPTFELNEENALAVAEICRSLDGLPLAIELAAVRVRIIPPAAILDRLGGRLQLLTGGSKDLPVRQQTVRAAIEWSYELLTEKDQTLFRRLAVFAGGFTLNAADSILGQSDYTALDGVTSLFNASLIVKMSGFKNEPRYRMLEVVREYALELFEACDEAFEFQQRHASYFLGICEEAEEHLRISQSAEWSNRLETEHDNLRLVLSWSFENNSDIAARLTAAIPMFWIQRGYLTEGRRWLAAAIDLTDDPRPHPTTRCRQLMGLGVLSKFQGDLEKAEGLFEEALHIGKAENDQDQIAWSKRQLGSVAHLKGETEKSRRYLEESLAINRERGHRPHTAYTLAELGSLLRAQGDFDSARIHFEESLGILRAMGHKAWIGLICWELGTVAYNKADFERAQSYYTESMLMAREIGFKSSISNCLDGFAALAAQRLDLERSSLLASAAQKLRDLIGLQLGRDDRLFVDSCILVLQSTLSENDLFDLWKQGQELELEDAIDLALDLVEANEPN